MVGWGVSGEWVMGIGNGRLEGSAVSGSPLALPSAKLRFGRTPPLLEWWFDGYFSPSYQYLSVPLWLPTALALAATITARRLDAKARRLNSALTCPRCAYPRAGLAAGAVCPECGSPAPTP
jgi:hypothetical protein